MKLLVSDDAPDDDTFSIVQREVAGYSGPHRVEVHRRRTNSGSKAAHLKKPLVKALDLPALQETQAHRCEGEGD
jgi:hypothetical protein